MDDFEFVLGRTMKDACAGLQVPGAMRGRVLRRAKRRRAGTVAAGALAVAALVVSGVVAAGDGVLGDRKPQFPIGPPRPADAYSAQAVTGGCGFDEPADAVANDLPQGAECVWAGRGDVDGDGELESLYTYGSPGGQGEGKPAGKEWLLTAIGPERSWNVQLQLPPQSSMSIFEPRLVGTADADGDGSSEVFVVLESGNDGASVGIYVLDDDLKLLSWSENPLIFSVANALNFRGGLTCEADGALRVVEASRSEDDTFAVSSETYRWRSASSLEPRAASEVRTGAAEQDDEVKKADGIHCRGLEWRF